MRCSLPSYLKQTNPDWYQHRLVDFSNSWIAYVYSSPRTAFLEQEMFLKHVCPPKHKCHCDLDLWSRNPKLYRGHLLVITSQVRRSLDCEFSSNWSDKVCLPTDQHVQSNTYTPTYLKGGIIICELIEKKKQNQNYQLYFSQLV